MTAKQTVDPATQKQLIKYAEDVAKLYVDLKKERELFSKSKRKKNRGYVESITKNKFFISI